MVFFSMARITLADFKHIDSLIGSNDSVILMSDTDECLYEKNAEKKLIPASSLKVLTALSAFHSLGDDFHYKTEFYLDDQHNLTIKGYGDPLLISEIISAYCDSLYPIVRQMTNAVNDIRFDDSYFGIITIPGVTAGSPEPYDAANGALCANFNTVAFFTDNQGNLVSDEEQTPLLPFVIKRIQSSGLKQGRIRLNTHESRLYAAYLFKYFLEKKGLIIGGKICEASVPSPDRVLIHTCTSPYPLDEIISKLLEFSNNFIANQLFLTMGARIKGPPANLDKGVAALVSYAGSQMDPKEVILSEGSGLSRKNRISARNMDRLLKQFQSHRFLMKKKDGVYYKTGTLDGISTRVGYFTGLDNRIYRFVVFCNTPGKSSEKITHMLFDRLKKQKGLSME